MIPVSSLSSTRTTHRGRAAAFALAVALLVALPAAAADRILDVRVGRHDEFTRIVFELDGSATHQVEQKPGAQELVVRLGATSAAREILSNSDIVQSVRLEPKGGETIARVVLRTSRVRVSELTLESPPRLVLDVRPGEPGPAVAQATKPAAPAPAPTAAPKPAPVAPPPAAKPATPPSTPLGAAPAPAPKPPTVVVEDEVEEVEDADGTEEIDETEILVQADTEAAADDAADAAADSAASAAAATAPGAPIKPAPSLAPPATTPPATKPAPAPGLPPTTTPTARPSGGLSDGIDPRWLVGAVALLAAFLLWGLFGRRDRTTREVEAADDSPANVFADRAAPATWAPEAAPSAAPTIEVPREDEAAEASPPSDLPLFTPRPEEPAPLEVEAAAPAETAATAADDDELPAPAERAAPRHLSVVPVEPPAAPEPAASFGAPVAAPAPAASFDVGSRVADLERRIQLLERKLEDAADVRERLERQVVAQTEELRVQRAAIARTQRVLRTLARPDDLPIEPAPRGSGPSGSGT